jgi:hypothetical protein
MSHLLFLLALTAQDVFHIRDWETCTVIGGLNACASLSMWEELPVPGYPDGQYVSAGLDAQPGYRIMAWGFFSPLPSDLSFNNYYGPSNWWSAPPEWTGFRFATGTDDPDYAFGGPQFGGEVFAGWFTGDDDVRDLRFAWRGLSDDGVQFDCLQAGDSRECISPFAVEAVTVTPEPSTWVLLLSGLGLLALVGRRRLC